jgi:predicted transcriptional regulator
MKTNITLKLDKDLLREIKILAAQEDRSISGLVTETLEELIRRRKGYEAARKRAIARVRNARDLGLMHPVSRDELHER